MAIAFSRFKISVLAILAFSTLFGCEFINDIFGLSNDELELQVLISGDGEVVAIPEKSKYEQGSNVELTAIPASGWSFSNWSEDATGSTNPLTVTMDASKSITANFTEIDPYTGANNIGLFISSSFYLEISY